MFKCFISYSHSKKDVSLLNELKKHLSALKDKLEVWVDDQIPPGSNWDNFIHQNLQQADIILMLVSSDFIASDYIQRIEVPQALARHKAGKAIVLPILLRKIYLNDQPFAHLEMVPKNPADQKLTPIAAWGDRDHAFTIIVEKLNSLLKKLTQPPAMPDSSNLAHDWATFFKKYPIKKRGPMLTVDCNRTKEYSDGVMSLFRNHCSDRKTQIFFISACDLQCPNSLPRRLIFDILENEMKIKYPCEPSDGYSLQIIEPKIGFQPLQTWANLWAKVTSQLNAQVATPEQLATQTICQHDEKVAFLVKISEKQWLDNEDVMEDHLSFILDQFKGMPEVARKFLVFLVFEFNKMESSRQDECRHVVETLDKLAKGITENSEGLVCHHISKLQAVTENDVLIWYKHYAENTGKVATDTFFKTLRQQLPDADRQRTDFDMIDVEAMQMEAWKSISKF